ncbi:hypothetical protein FHX81_7617 [Saccharothrix saharensis]|uniref:Uncharacterized protein n=1 Tax=Saccharothrix saharensis TaxID=571190 RepID=A0A543JQW2_9PSEU|nr:hypothetical protein FHX81_7617 [Saccharothrix saharensis]
MECEPGAEPPRPVPTGWWPEPDTIAWVGRAPDDEPEDHPGTGPDDEANDGGE